ncbi:DUF6911 family protein, partial [Psychrobacter sp. NPDC078370]|uniref:DUF6911 family protein n=1 Tax=unclassified Psychrobacter TaxID=196806 RepID=UPI003CFE5935
KLSFYDKVGWRIIYLNYFIIWVVLLLFWIDYNCRGTVMIENVLAKEDIEPLKLTVYMANGRYLLMLLDYDDEGYLDVRTAYNPDASRDDWEYVNGELHSSTTVISDLEVVKQCFLEFNATGNVSKSILD